MVVKFGVDALPSRIKNFLLSRISTRPAIPGVYHVTGLTHCLRKLWYRIKHPEECGFSLESCYHIFRGFSVFVDHDVVSNGENPATFDIQ
ncbi:hypothetical protein ES703_100731 [subsurface metagenome]